MISTSEYSAFLAEDRRQPAIIGMVVVTTLSLLVVLVRLYARGYRIHELGWDDLTIVIAQLVSWVVLWLSLMGIHHGSGKHMAALTDDPEGMMHMYKWLLGTQLVYMFNIWLCRISGIAFYARLNQMPRFTLYIRISFVFVTLVYVAQTIITALQCIVPLGALWGVEGKCMGAGIVFISTSGLTIICDSLVLLLPMNIVFSLQANLARKLTLAVVLCMGVFAVITSIMRTVSMTVALKHPNDATWYFPGVMIWSATEISAAIIALSLPALRALFGVWNSKRSRNETKAIDLQLIPQSAKQPMFDGCHADGASFDVDWRINRSQGVKDEEVRVEEIVRVGIGRRLSR